ncbi:hypothetical protein SAMN05216189_1003188 [Pseudomonas delhiensis]|uniref:Uncharacterized protein n=1 Tax=Pseudomonas delhiensis TaxID=366289 RepID=A0A239LWX2_9PSED|nr:hypothetical protein [Pseudomonas delhiensis]SDI26339.1 hypothetical protein SAMN05216189_1003188 [Pseudomonas delhiensis]SNT34114.1 hypothetical protein SAMN06295949_12229 [Pseudomonas delhiensis]
MERLLSPQQQKEAVDVYLRLVPTLAREIELSQLASDEDLDAYRLRKGWAELCAQARCTGLEPWLFAHMLIGTSAAELERLKALRRHLTIR